MSDGNCTLKFLQLLLILRWTLILILAYIRIPLHMEFLVLPLATKFVHVLVTFFLMMKLGDWHVFVIEHECIKFAPSN